VRAIGRIPKPEFDAADATGVPAPLSRRPVWFPDTGFVETPVYRREAWAPGTRLSGPAVIDEYDSTTVVLPGQTWWTDATGSILIEEEE
jgi:N-methylhydantoinase A